MVKVPTPLQDALTWANIARPEVTAKQRQTALGVHFEEVSEMIATLQGRDRLTQSLLTSALVALHGLALHLKTSQPEAALVINHIEHVDALADQIVTAVGVAQAFGYDIVGAVDEVNASNFSKFVDGKAVFDANMKIVKGPNYRPAALAQFVP